jgi:hypothetical protein
LRLANLIPALALTAVVAALLILGIRVASAGATRPACPPGSLVVNATGTFICAFEVANYTPVFASLYLSQEESSFSGVLTCLVSSGCLVSIEVYDYYKGELGQVDTFTRNLRPGESVSWNYTVRGRGVVEVYVNDVFLGYYTAQIVPHPVAVPSVLSELAREHPLLTVVIGLLIVGVPLGWALQRELGLAGLALVGASMLIYVFTRVLIGDDAVAVALATVCGLVGLILIVVQGGQL